MDIATVGGLVVGFALIIVVMILSGDLMMYWDFMSLVIVLGGSICSVLMRWPVNVFVSGLQEGINAILIKVEPPSKVIDDIVNLATTARAQSLLALESIQVDNILLAKGVKLAVDGADPNVIDQMLSEDIKAQKKRFEDGRGVYEDLAEACPAFGMIGTVIGLIVIMANLSDPSKIGPGLAVALVTTLYGALIANMIFVPLAKKLKFRANEELRNFAMIRIGVASILEGLNPRLIRERLEANLD